MSNEIDGILSRPEPPMVSQRRAEPLLYELASSNSDALDLVNALFARLIYLEAKSGWYEEHGVFNKVQ